ncbi:hypothetical protein F5879DRAFT_811359 [Lentinula edodes]|nr:hypothetical protein F5879DRAFT_811359 [Lentinula edodes]
MRTKRQLEVWQINANKSDDCMHDFLHNDKGKADIIAVQEPYIDWKGATRALSHLHTIYPTGHLENFTEMLTWSLISINSSILTEDWARLDIESGDVTAVQITGPFGMLRIFNIYNDCNHNRALQAVE